jgi:hypothetical protein
MAQMVGFVSIVQEGRFQLTDDDGVSHLFTLSPSAAMEPAGLQALPRTRARVCVSYKPAPGTIGNVAMALCLVQ